MESAFVLQSMEAPLLLERGLQVAQHTELGEHDGSGVVAVERAHLPVLKMEDINARDVELLTGCGGRVPRPMGRSPRWVPFSDS